MGASREFSRTPRRLPPCSDVSVVQKTRMSHFWDTHHTFRILPSNRTCALYYVTRTMVRVPKMRHARFLKD